MRLSIEGNTGVNRKLVARTLTKLCKNVEYVPMTCVMDDTKPFLRCMESLVKEHEKSKCIAEKVRHGTYVVTEGSAETDRECFLAAQRGVTRDHLYVYDTLQKELDTAPRFASVYLRSAPNRCFESAISMGKSVSFDTIQVQHTLLDQWAKRRADTVLVIDMDALGEIEGSERLQRKLVSAVSARFFPNGILEYTGK